MDTKISVVFSFIAIAAAVLLFAAGPLVATYQALACGGGFGGRLLRLLQLFTAGLRRLAAARRRLRRLRLVDSTANKHQKLKRMVKKDPQILFIFIGHYCSVERYVKGLFQFSMVSMTVSFSHIKYLEDITFLK